MKYTNQVYNMPGRIPRSKMNCGANGTFTKPSTCRCKEGWSGDRCQTADAPKDCRWTECGNPGRCNSKPACIAQDRLGKFRCCSSWDKFPLNWNASTQCREKYGGKVTGNTLRPCTKATWTQARDRCWAVGARMCSR